MTWQALLYLAPLVASAALSIMVTLYGWRQREAQGAVALAWLMLLIAAWSLILALMLCNVSPGFAFWANLTYLPIALIPVLFVIFVLSYLGQDDWLTHWRLVPLFSVPVITQVLVWMDPALGLFTPGDEPPPILHDGLLLPAPIHWGPGLVLHTVYSYLMLLLGAVLVLWAQRRVASPYRRQAAMVLVALIPGWLTNVFVAFNNEPWRIILVPVGMMITGLAFGFAIFRYRLLHLAPVARDALIERMRDGLIVIDTDDRIVDLNPVALKLIGQSKRKTIGQSAVDLPAPWRDLLLQAAHLGESADDLQVWQDGSAQYYNPRISPLTDRQGHLRGHMVLLRDVTPRVQAEEALHRSEQEFRTLAENAPDGITRLDRHLRYVYISPAAASMFGKTTAEMLGQTWQEMGLPRDLCKIWHSANLQVVETRQAQMVEFAFPSASGVRYLQAHIVPEFARDGSVETLLHIVRDVTGQKQAQVERARRVEEDAILEERRRIAREIHDGLAQDLASLRLRLNVWETLIDRDPSRLRDELKRGRDLLGENIREVRRSIFALRPLILEQVGLCAALESFATAFGELNGVPVALVIAGPRERLPRVLEPVVMRIVQEAMNNISKHAHASAARIALNLESPDRLVLQIEDNGTGFDPAILQRAAPAGHLGLAEMCERVRALGGTVEVHSVPGQGTSILVTLGLTKS